MHFKQFCCLIFVKEWEYFCVIRRKSVKNSYKKDTKQKQNAYSRCLSKPLKKSSCTDKKHFPLPSRQALILSVPAEKFLFCDVLIFFEKKLDFFRQVWYNCITKQRKVSGATRSLLFCEQGAVKKWQIRLKRSTSL